MSTRRRIVTVAVRAVLVAAALSGAACRQDMHDQPKYTALEASTFFENGQASRLPPEGTVARGHLRADRHLYEGVADGRPATTFPFPVDDAVMARGQDMYNAFCSPCHGVTGAGDGMVVQRGFTPPPPLTAEYLRRMPPSYFFSVITNGRGAMPDHRSQIKPEDRWAIAAYLRALQLAAGASIDDVPPAERGRLEP
ncbi:MAG: cytochrome c [Vicinamibacterales bacterium]